MTPCLHGGEELGGQRGGLVLGDSIASFRRQCEGGVSPAMLPCMLCTCCRTPVCFLPCTSAVYSFLLNLLPPRPATRAHATLSLSLSLFTTTAHTLGHAHIRHGFRRTSSPPPTDTLLFLPTPSVTPSRHPLPSPPPVAPTLPSPHTRYTSPHTTHIYVSYFSRKWPPGARRLRGRSGGNTSTRRRTIRSLASPRSATPTLTSCRGRRGTRRTLAGTRSDPARYDREEKRGGECGSVYSLCGDVRSVCSMCRWGM